MFKVARKISVVCFALALALFYPIEQAFLRIGKRLRLLQKR